MFLDSCMSSTGKDLLIFSQNAHVPLQSNGHRFVGDVSRGIRVSAHLRSHSLLIQALQTRATNLGKRPLHNQAQPLQLSCDASSEAKGTVLGLLGRPKSDRSRCTTIAGHRVELNTSNKKILNLHRSHTAGKCAPREHQKHTMWMLQYHRTLVLRCSCATMSWHTEWGGGRRFSRSQQQENNGTTKTHPHLRAPPPPPGTVSSFIREKLPCVGYTLFL